MYFNHIFWRQKEFEFSINRFPENSWVSFYTQSKFKMLKILNYFAHVSRKALYKPTDFNIYFLLKDFQIIKSISYFRKYIVLHLSMKSLLKLKNLEKHGNTRKKKGETTKCCSNKLIWHLQKEKGISTNLKMRESTKNSSKSSENSKIGVKKLRGKKFSRKAKTMIQN